MFGVMKLKIALTLVNITPNDAKIQNTTNQMTTDQKFLLLLTMQQMSMELLDELNEAPLYKDLFTQQGLGGTTKDFIKGCEVVSNQVYESDPLNGSTIGDAMVVISTAIEQAFKDSLG